MRYRALSSTYDWTPVGYDNSGFLVNSPETVAQAVLTRLRFFKSEWFLNLDDGTPYQQGALGTGKRNLIEPMLRQRILETQGVESIVSFSLLVDDEKRSANVNATINTIYGVAKIVEVV